MFALRAAVMTPAYLRNDVASLGLAATLLGLPLFAAVLLGTWLIIRRVPVAHPEPVDDEMSAVDALEVPQAHSGAEFSTLEPDGAGPASA
jgi:hypothetical protein